MDGNNFEYRNGRTQPRKSRSGLIAALLICVIFLSGLVSVLGLMNIRLLGLLKQQDTGAPLAFSCADDSLSQQPADGTPSLALAGMQVQELPDLYRQLYNLPEGLYISQVQAGSHAGTLGIAPGDILVCVDTTPVSRLDALQALTESRDRINITVFRDGNQYPFSLTLTE